jgi:hypothetical protein
MSRWSSLYQALAKASAKASGSSRNRSAILRYSGSARRAMSVVAIIGWCATSGRWASGTVPAPASPSGFHCLAPAGLWVSSHS